MLHSVIRDVRHPPFAERQALAVGGRLTASHGLGLSQVWSRRRSALPGEPRHPPFGNPDTHPSCHALRIQEPRHPPFLSRPPHPCVRGPHVRRRTTARPPVISTRRKRVSDAAQKVGVFASGKARERRKCLETQKPFIATLRVNESRPAEPGRQPEASLAWGGVTLTAKRRQRVSMPCYRAPKYSSWEPPL